MKRVLFILLISLNVYSQAKEQKTCDNWYEEFDYYAQPDKNNSLSRHIKNHINIELLKAVKLGYKDNNKNRLFLTFKLDEDNSVKGIHITSPYSELNNSIKKAFNSYDFEELNIPEKNQLNIYVLQILSTEDENVIVNCSTNIIYDRFPVFEGCESITTYNKMKKCINRQLEAHVVKHISPVVIKNEKIIGQLKLNPQFLIDKKGFLKNINSKTTSKGLADELDRVIALFPKAKTPATRNGNPTSLNYEASIILQIDAKDESYKEEITKTRKSILKADSELALHFKKHLTEKDLENVVFPLAQNHVTISFNISKKRKLDNMKANSMNSDFNKKIINIFKKFPDDKLIIDLSNVLPLYTFNIITKGQVANIIEIDNEPEIFLYPIFNKKCAKSKSPDGLKQCFSENVTDIIINNFDTNIRHKTKLTGEIGIFCTFQLDTLGQFIKVKVRSPNPFITNEIETLIKEIPKVYRPAYFNGKPTQMPFTLPIRYFVGQNKPEDPFKDLRRKN